MAEAQGISDRINLVYESRVGERSELVELPFRVLVLADLTGDERSAEFDEQQPIPMVEADIGLLFQRLRPALDLRVGDCLGDDGGELQLRIEFNALEDFDPARVMRAVPALAALLGFVDSLSRLSGDEAAPREGDLELIERVLGAESVTLDEVRGNAREYGWLVSSLEEKICRQIDAILHHDDFRRLETAWRTVQFLIERTDFSENCELAFVNVAKQALLDDFEDVPEVFQSQLYQHIYADEFGQFGGRPYGLLLGDYEFGPGARDIKLMQRIAAVATVSHAPFVAAAAAEFFDIDSYARFGKLRDIGAIFQQPKYAKWNAFRATPDARYLGLAMPGFLLRRAHDTSIGSLQYRENIADADRDLPWGNTAFAFATRLLDSFAHYRWCLNSIGDSGGKVTGLGMDDGGSHAGNPRIPTRFLLTDRRETDVVEQGFIPLSVRRGQDTVAFYSAYSTQAVRELMGEDNDLSLRLAAQIPYLLIIGRLSHYLKIMQRENIGTWTNRREIDQHLNEWLRQYVSDMDNPAPGVRARRPLRKAEVKVREVEGKEDWYLSQIRITPHLKFMGQSFDLSETGRLDKN